MNYGLYLSATGVLTNSYRQDVIANNIANAETVGFKRDVALFRQRLTEAEAQRRPDLRHELFDLVGGGHLLAPTVVDQSQGALELTGSNLDAAIAGSGYFAVRDGNEIKLTRDGRFMIGRDGHLILANGSGQKVLDRNQRPIPLDGLRADQLTISERGEITQDGQLVAQLGVFDVPDPGQLRKEGGTLLSYPEPRQIRSVAGTVHGGFLERSNVDPTVEMTRLMESQRQLEANANMIRYQDQTLGRLVNEVGKIG
jgi:flagellar basal-body rod protein FlgF